MPFPRPLQAKRPQLGVAMVAMLGDGSDKSVPGLYYNWSALKTMIDRQLRVEGGQNWALMYLNLSVASEISIISNDR